jgi:hypothetical protein
VGRITCSPLLCRACPMLVSSCYSVLHLFCNDGLSWYFIVYYFFFVLHPALRISLINTALLKVPVHVMKSYRGSRGEAAIIIKLNTIYCTCLLPNTRSSDTCYNKPLPCRRDLCDSTQQQREGMLIRDRNPDAVTRVAQSSHHATVCLQSRSTTCTRDGVANARYKKLHMALTVS